MTPTEKNYWILWNRFYSEIGPARFGQLLRVFGSAEKAWFAPDKELEKLGWGSNTLKKLQNRDKGSVTSIMGSSISSCYSVITREEVSYPKNLLQIDASPPVLYVKGRILPQDGFALAVVGSRRMTSYGKNVVDALVPELARAGLTIISGLALGVDAAAHRAALSVGGRTIAVLPCGINSVYPPSNNQLASEIAKNRNGALVSEFPPDTQIEKSNFPIRNRTISGLSLAVLVIEASIGSGTFHTVESALEQGKDVFAVPGPIFSPYSEGCAELIRNGAKPITKARDILEDLNLQT